MGGVRTSMMLGLRLLKGTLHLLYGPLRVSRYATLLIRK
jgi:hypothetical protein